MFITRKLVAEFGGASTAPKSVSFHCRIACVHAGSNGDQILSRSESRRTPCSSTCESMQVRMMPPADPPPLENTSSLIQGTKICQKCYLTLFTLEGPTPFHVRKITIIIPRLCCRVVGLSMPVLSIICKFKRWLRPTKQKLLFLAKISK